MAQLSQEPTVDHQILWGYLRTLIENVVTAVDREALLDECLDMLVETFGADRGLILLTDPTGATFAVNARGKNRALSAYDREEISRTVIHEVRKTGRSILWEPDINAAGGTASMMTLGIVAALAAPLRPVAAGIDEVAVTSGVVYLDFRDVDKELGELHREFFEAAASLISIVLDQSQKLQVSQESLREALAHATKGPPMPTLADLLRSPSMAPIRDEIESSLHSELPILITGESGTGKTLLARAISEASGRTPLVRAMLGQSDDLNTIASELFGHEKGSYSGALTKRIGLVEFANEGTIILDEILNLPQNAQQLLLDFTQFGDYRPLGHNKPDAKRSNVRIISATNGDMEAALADGTFREDLYYRLAAIRIAMPALRERRGDIPSLAEGYLRRRDPDRDWTLSVPVRRMLLSADLEWPGNVRQLESAIQRARERAMAADKTASAIELDHIKPHDLGVKTAPSSQAPAAGADGGAGAPNAAPGDVVGRWENLLAERDKLERTERDILQAALDKHGGVVARAARELGIARTSLVSRLQTLQITPDD
jgi:transcriptional regulator with GAF, ATPase, and Fis domain